MIDWQISLVMQYGFQLNTAYTPVGFLLSQLEIVAVPTRSAPINSLRHHLA
jgi:hypothetical protein